jgi:hypothetical protein
MVIKEFISCEQALELKELGFNDDCLGYYNIDPNAAQMPFLCIYKPYKNEFCLPAPIYQQAFRFFREKYELHGELFSQKRPSDNFKYAFKISDKDIMYDGYDTYEEAELACLKKLIEIAKNKKP